MQDSSFSLLLRLVRDYVRPYYGRIFLAIIAMIIVAATTALNAWMMQPALDKIFLKMDAKMLVYIPLAVVVTALIKGVASYYQIVLMKYVGQRIVTDMQLKLYEHLLYADLSMMQVHSSGKLISRFTNDITVMRGSVSTVLTGIAKELLTVIFLVGVMLYQNITLSLIAFAVFPIAVYPLIRLGKRMRKIANRTQEELGQYTAQLDDTFQGIRVVKAYQQERAEITRARSMVEGIFALYMKAARTGSSSSPLLETLSGIAIGAVIWYGGHQVIEGVTTPGSFFSFIAALIMAYKPVKSLADLNSNLQEGLAAAKRLFAILDIKQKVEEKPEAASLQLKQGQVRFDQVAFAYNAEKQALENISFEIPAGKTVALVGASGSGKSTIMNLLLRFYDPGQGAITIDGEDIRDVTIASLRGTIAFVGQEVILFDDTVMANILYGKPDATQEEVIEASKHAAAHEFITQLPAGYDTVIGQHGMKLSGGQRQRLAIARAFLRNSPIFLLDEATSALDPISENAIQQALKNFRTGRTTLIIAHRLSTVVDADCICVVKEGQIVESGSHAELLSKQGEYSRLYSKQSG